MNRNLFSSHWYLVGALKPRIRSHAQIHRHRYRGETWYVLQDLSTDRFHRFSPTAYFVIGLMDGRRTVQEIWEAAAGRLGDDAPTQDEVIELLSQLHGADALQCEVPPNVAELLRRHELQERRKWQSTLLSPLAWRVPLWDPERFLGLFLPLVRPLMGWAGLLLWFGVVGLAILLAAVHWSELTENVVDLILTPRNLLLLWLLFPIIKALHELGHGFVTKAFGGEVHDMGVMVLVLTPIPYVDASSAWAFREKWQRVAVGAAGIMVELFLAALAFFLWLHAEPGMVRTLAYNAMIIGGVSTVLFNGNPLLRYDGYYILADLLEIPNLRFRSSSYIGYLRDRYLFGSKEAEPPEATRKERFWYATYGTASFVYRIFVVVAIILFIAGNFFVIGLILAALAAVAWLAVPAFKATMFLLTSPRIESVRTRAILLSALVVALLGGVLGLVPVPFRTQAEGVVWIPDESYVRAGTECFVEQVVARPGSAVQKGDVLIVCRDPVLVSEIRVWEARLRELKARYDAERMKDLVETQKIQEEIRYAEQALARARERTSELVIRSRADGTFVAPRAYDLPGRFVRKGETVAHVVNLQVVTVRAVVPQPNIDMVRHQTQKVEVRLAERISETARASMIRFVPEATERLPSTALGTVGGGQIKIDPTDAAGMKAIEKVFQVDLELPSQAAVVNVGGRVYVRFDHGWEPLLSQWYRQVRQLFLSRFNV